MPIDALDLEPDEDTPQLHGISFHPDGDLLAAAYSDMAVRIWDIHRREVAHTIDDLSGSIAAVAFGPDGSRLAASTWDGTVYVWDVSEWDVNELDDPALLLQDDERQRQPIRGLAFNLTGDRLATASNDKTIAIWDMSAELRKPRLIVQLRAAHSDRVLAVAFHPWERNILVSASADGKTAVWDLQGLPRMGAVVRRGEVGSTSTAFSADGTKLALGGRYGTIIVRDSASDTAEVFDHRGPLHERHEECLRGTSILCAVTGIGFFPDGSRLATFDRGGEVRILQTSGRLLESYRHRPAEASTRPSFLQIAPNGRYILTHDPSNGMMLVEVSEDSDTTPIISHLADCEQGDDETDTGPDPCSVTSAIFIDGGERLVTGSRDGTVAVWDIETKTSKVIAQFGQEVAALALPEQGVNGLAVALREGRIEVLDGADPASLPAIAPGTSAASADARPQTTGIPIELEDRIWSLAFSPDGSIMAVGLRLGGLVLYDVATQRKLGRTLSGHDYSCLSDDNTSPCRVTSLSFHPTDAGILLSSSGHGLTARWTVDPQSMKEAVCRRANRRLDPISDGLAGTRAWRACHEHIEPDSAT